MVDIRMYQYPPEIKPTKEEAYNSAMEEFNHKREARKYLNRIHVKEKAFIRNDYLTQFINNKKRHEENTADLHFDSVKEKEKIINRTSPEITCARLFNSHMKEPN